MSFKVFEKDMPEVYSLAGYAERILETDHILALNHLKEIGQSLVKKILVNENVEIHASDPFINLAALMEIEILPFHMVTTLKQLEYLDTRESSLFIEINKVKALMLEIYDLTAWYYKTFINDQFILPPLLLDPQIGTVVIPPEGDTEPTLIRSVIHIDNKKVEGIWESVKDDQIFIEYESGETYQGQMKNGLKCGTGVYRWSDGSKYEGQWFNDREYGFGVKEYANGDSYRGEWKDGLYNGNGIYKWNDGTLYEGGWLDNLEHGYGTKIHRTGYVQKGFWTRGELVFNKDQLNQSKPSINE
ncbi:hypothetical protein M3231_01075 [Neobacillus mesonae]|nr:hypothetical protein [Neobacillus mesonae]